MSEHPRWPLVDITQAEFLQALKALEVEGLCLENLQEFSTEGETPVSADGAMEAFIEAASTPEMRLKLAEATNCTYAELTSWVIWADLMRIEGVNLPLAKALAAAGVAGVQDLALKTADEDRLKKLRQGLAPNLPPDQSPDLKALGKSAARLRSKTVTDTSVILVVKGAGSQKPNETLDGFLNGFWPAIRSINPQAQLRHRMDILPKDYRSSPYDKDPLNVVVEIESGERRIWLKEPYWDVAALIGNPIAALTKEWRMATYAFGSWVDELMSEKDTRLVQNPKNGIYRPKLWRFYTAFLIMHLFIFLPLLFTGITAHIAGELPAFFQSMPLREFAALAGGAAVVVSLVVSIFPASQTHQELRSYHETKKPFKALPGMGNWVLGLLLAAFFLNPWGYLIFILLLAVIHLALLRARSLAWPYRDLSNSDTCTSNFYSVEGETGSSGRPLVYKIDNPSATLRRGFVFIYRYVVVLGLPLSFLAIVIARALQWTRFLAPLGNAVESSLNLALSGVLGDVVNYALDPAQASRVRGVLESDIQFFHEMEQVSGLHVFAHSQGTPITFETLYRSLPDLYRRKVKTYVTIGSVLSYYRQCNPILDPLYSRRFPVLPYPEFASGFKWMNFWNLVDPITEFYGLDEYNLIKEAPLLTPEEADQKPLRLTKEHLAKTKRYEASPTNIKTKANFQHHSEYWSNLDQVQIPFAKRVLGDLRPKEWNPDKLRTLPGRLPHAYAVALLWVLWGVLFSSMAWLVITMWGGLAFHGPLADLLTNLVNQAASGWPAWTGFLLHKLVQLAAAGLTIALTLGLVLIIHSTTTFVLEKVAGMVFAVEKGRGMEVPLEAEEPAARMN
jgi:hypothetical protein